MAQESNSLFNFFSQEDLRFLRCPISRWLFLVIMISALLIVGGKHLAEPITEGIGWVMGIITLLLLGANAKRHYYLPDVKEEEKSGDEYRPMDGP